MVGTAGFEPTTPDTPWQCATKLRYVPTLRFILLAFVAFAMLESHLTA